MTWQQKILNLVFAILLSTPAWAVKPVQILTRSLVGGQNAVAYSATVKAKFGTKPYTWSIGSGALPTGLNIAGATGVISGTPTVNNTFNFVVHVVDSAGSPTSNDRSLYIVITGAAPAPTPAVSISTGTVPNGVVGGAYSTTLQAAGGTSPYTWSQPAGVLPAGVSLAATGIASGTPTAAGTYSFTARVADSSPTPQTADRAFAVTVAAGGTYTFSDGFESGNFAGWTDTSCGDGSYCPEVQSSIKHAGIYAYGQRYVICGDSTNPACGSNSADRNRWIARAITPGTHFFTRSYVYLKAPENGIQGRGAQRKLIWVGDDNAAGGATWDIIVTTFESTLGTPSTSYLAVLSQGSACHGSQDMLWGNSTTPYLLSWDIWYSVELEFQMNTPSATGPYDGIARLWLNGVAVPLHRTGEAEATSITNFKANGNCTNNASWFTFGRQTNRYNYQAVDEYRYWDDIVINTTGPIGP